MWGRECQIYSFCLVLKGRNMRFENTECRHVIKVTDKGVPRGDGIKEKALSIPFSSQFEGLEGNLEHFHHLGLPGEMEAFLSNRMESGYSQFCALAEPDESAYDQTVIPNPIPHIA